MMKTIQASLMYFVFLVALLHLGCKENKKETQSEMEMVQTESEKNHIEKTTFGETPDGEQVDKYTLTNNNGMEVDIITYGGIITRWTAPDKNGTYQDVVLGFNDLDSYFGDVPYFGALVGRYGNRIAKGQFSLDGETYTLAKNNGPNHLHGGLKGFDKKVWKAQPENTNDGAVLVLTCTSADGEEGYPGKLDVTVTYTLKGDNELDIQYEAVTDKPTVVNLTQHTYFNLSGDFSQDILNNEVTLNASTYLPVDAGLIPTGELRPVAGTPFDFTQPKAVGKEINADNEQIQRGGGYDHCWVLNGTDGNFGLAASVYNPETGRLLEVYTDEPGIQFYTGNFMDGSLASKSGGTYGKRSGLCLETQHFPDSPNQEAFPTTRLNPGEKYSSHTSFKFSTK